MILQWRLSKNDLPDGNCAIMLNQGTDAEKQIWIRANTMANAQKKKN